MREGDEAKLNPTHKTEPKKMNDDPLQDDTASRASFRRMDEQLILGIRHAQLLPRHKMRRAKRGLHPHRLLLDVVGSGHAAVRPSTVIDRAVRTSLPTVWRSRRGATVPAAVVSSALPKVSTRRRRRDKGKKRTASSHTETQFFHHYSPNYSSPEPLPAYPLHSPPPPSVSAVSSSSIRTGPTRPATPAQSVLRPPLR